MGSGFSDFGGFPCREPPKPLTALPLSGLRLGLRGLCLGVRLRLRIFGPAAPSGPLLCARCARAASSSRLEGAAPKETTPPPSLPSLQGLGKKGWQSRFGRGLQGRRCHCRLVHGVWLGSLGKLLDVGEPKIIRSWHCHFQRVHLKEVLIKESLQVCRRCLGLLHLRHEALIDGSRPFGPPGTLRRVGAIQLGDTPLRTLHPAAPSAPSWEPIRLQSRCSRICLKQWTKSQLRIQA